MERVSSLIGLIMAFAWIGIGTNSVLAENGEIVHDAEYYVLERQNADQWTADNAAVDAKLAKIRAANGGKPPNILYILIDDIGFGEIGEPYLNYVRGYETPNINSFADEGLRFIRLSFPPKTGPLHLPGKGTGDGSETVF